MLDRPIIFSAPMVRALLEGRKTQTQRLAYSERKTRNPAIAESPTFTAQSPWLRVQPGDRLWVREEFSLDRGGSRICWWWADGNPEFGDWTRPKPSIHMPRWASRLTLTVTAVKVERLQQISEADAHAEGAWGAVPGMHPDHSAGAHFKHLWNSLHGAGAWAANPEVVALSFTVARQNIDYREAPDA